MYSVTRFPEDESIISPDNTPILIISVTVFYAYEAQVNSK